MYEFCGSPISDAKVCEKCALVEDTIDSFMINSDIISISKQNSFCHEFFDALSMGVFGHPVLFLYLVDFTKLV